MAAHAVFGTRCHGGAEWSFYKADRRWLDGCAALVVAAFKRFVEQLTMLRSVMGAMWAGFLKALPFLTTPAYLMIKACNLIRR